MKETQINMALGLIGLMAGIVIILLGVYKMTSQPEYPYLSIVAGAGSILAGFRLLRKKERQS